VPDRTRPMGVTMPMDYCYHCHKDIGETRPNHARFAFDSCATAGCHNFHDNRGLNEPFLRAHLDDKDHLDKQVIAKRMPRKTAAWDAAAVSALVANDADTPSGVEADANLHSDWAASTHARAGVNCTSCHHAKDEATGTTAWIDRPDHTSCNGCHTHEVEGFLAGRHGMRLAAGFSAMTPAKARLPMKRDAAHRELSCVSCHSDHRFDTTFAAADACVSCHDDGHTLAYKDSPHAALWRAEVAGDAEAGTGVSCATCHLPREVHRSSGVEIARVQHNQNDNLRPNEKMLRNVCVSCHGAQFALNALADRALIDRNFTGDAATHVTSLELIRTKLAEIERKRKERRSRQ